MGNNYKVDLLDLLSKRQSVAGRSTTISRVGDLEKRSFFCSELIAKAFKELGLMDTVKSSSTFLPKEFSAYGGKAQVRNEVAHLDYDRLIIIEYTELELQK